MSDKTTAVARAVRLLRSKGWTCNAPRPAPKYDLMADQCQFPDLREAPGDTCTHSICRSRTTKRGWLWLCDAHYDAPLSQLFDKRENLDG